MRLPATIKSAFQEQAEACRRLGSPFTARICELLSEQLDAASDAGRFGRRIAEWSDTTREDALALRAAGALHGLARSGSAPALSALYPPHAAPGDEALGLAIAHALRDHDTFLCGYLDGPPQTNEVARSSALLGAGLVIARRSGLTLSWNELGASAGLNLGFDRYAYELGEGRSFNDGASVLVRSEWLGDAPALDTSIAIAERAGCDANPLDPSSSATRDRLLSYVWPDQEERLRRTQAALELAAHAPWRVERGLAADWVAQRFSRPPQSGVARVLAHTIVWQYLSREQRQAVIAAMTDAGARATSDAPVAWFSMEADGTRDSAVMRLTFWPGGVREIVGRADFHGRWVRWN